MKISTKIVKIKTHGPNKLFDITDHLKSFSENIGQGFVNVFSKGSTGALVLLPRKKEIVEQFEEDLWDLVEVYGWRHPGNAYAHLRSTLIGTNLVILVEEGKLLIPEEHSVFFVENQPYVMRERTIVFTGISTG